MQFTDKMAAALGYYAGHRNKTKAYMHAYNCENMTPKTINQKAYELFRHPLMAQAVEQMKAESARKLKIDASWLLHRAVLLADFNIEQFIVTDEEGNSVYDFSEATDDDWYCISEYTVETLIRKDKGGNFYPVEKVKLKSESKLRALEMVAKLTGAQGYNGIKIEHAGTVGVAHISTEEYKAAREELLQNDDC